jgi:tetratricopeptide (TPR) repeat protein
MARAFKETDGVLGERLMRAIEAGQAAGGDSRGMQSAAILIVRAGGGYGGFNDRYCDLRVDDHATPIAELRRLFDMWKGWALIDEGYRLCDAGAYEKAIAVGLENVALDPESAEPRYHLACYYSRAGRGEDALSELGRAVVLDGSLKARAKADPDFKPLLDAPAFRSLTAD